MAKLLSLLTVSAFAVSDPQWQDFKAKFSKSYTSPAEENRRYSVFKSNLASIAAHNKDPSKTYKRGINHFSDFTQADLQADRLMSLPYPEEDIEMECPLRFKAPENIKMPSSLDWRDPENNPKNLNAVTQVKDQGSCGSCYIFSATGAMEGSLCLNGFFNCTTFEGLSEQQPLDCGSWMKRDYDNWTEYPQWYEFYGCSGGWPGNVMQYAYWNRGISCLGKYPYRSGTEKFDNLMNQDECYYDPSMSHGYPNRNICGTTSKDGPDAIAMAEAIYFKGPVSISMYVGGTFSSYTSGVYVPAEDDCPNLEKTGINHCMLAVGWGEEMVNGEMMPYWIIKNSWGPEWGDNGFFKVIRGVNACGVEGNIQYADMIGVHDDEPGSGEE